MNAPQSHSPTTLDHWIGGQAVPPQGGTYFDDLSPLDDSVYARAADGNVADVERAVQAAQQAFPGFRKLLAKDREALLQKAAALLERDRQEFVDILIDEVGSPLVKAGFEVQFAVGMLRAAAGVPRRITGHTLPSDSADRWSLSLREPLGVVAGITPFNVPMIKVIKQSAMALACGNTFVNLPSEHAPRLSLRVAQLYQEAGFPAGSFNVVLGNGAAIGDALTGHPLVKSVTFTGSSVVGRHIAEICARQLKKFTLELGGKSPLIVMDDADLGAAVRAAAMGTFFYQGQACMASSRILVQRGIFERFAQALAGAAAGLKGGDLRDQGTTLGPIISGRQRGRVKTHIEDATAKGARVLAGGSFSGFQCAPTVLTDVTPDMTLFYEETFGPVTALYPFDTLEDALAMANDTPYGLSAAIYTSNINHALQAASGIHAGMVHINAPSLYDEPQVPFGGVGQSGYGREGTDCDLDAMTEWKWVTIQLPTDAPGHH
nr:B87 [uncultured bacterium]ART39901.1 J517 [uncultured bacterium]